MTDAKEAKTRVVYPPEMWELIRALWEGNHNMSHERAGIEAAKQLGLPTHPTKAAISVRQKRDEWIRGNKTKIAVDVDVAPKEVKRPVRVAVSKPTPVNNRKPIPQELDDGYIEAEREDGGLTDQETVFVTEYVATMDFVRAAKRVGLGVTRPTLIRRGREMMERPRVDAAIKAAFAELQRRTGITTEMVMARLWDIASADPNDLVQYKVGNCRYCWGNNHEYQWTEAEYERAVSQAENTDPPMTPPSCDGGFGFNKNEAPNPDCPECGGDGWGRQVIKDTTKLDGAARLLYAGMEQTKDGLKIKMHDQMDALQAVAKQIGMFREKVDVNVNMNVNTDQLQEIYQRKIAESRQRGIEARARVTNTFENGEIVPDGE